MAGPTCGNCWSSCPNRVICLRPAGTEECPGQEELPSSEVALGGTLRALSSAMTVRLLVGPDGDPLFGSAVHTTDPPCDFVAFVAQRRGIDCREAEQLVQGWVMRYQPRSKATVGWRTEPDDGRAAVGCDISPTNYRSLASIVHPVRGPGTSVRVCDSPEEWLKNVVRSRSQLRRPRASDPEAFQRA